MRIIAFSLIIFSSLTFALPKETFDPHIGVDDDIFCKSLYAIGHELAFPCESIIKQIIAQRKLLEAIHFEVKVLYFYASFNKAPPIQ